LLGPVTVVGLIAGMSMTRLREAATPAAAAASDLVVRHSLASAYLAQRLVETIDPARRPAQSGEAYTAGLLHDLGKLVLLHNFPDEAAALYGGTAPEAPESEE
ncbi:HDOD domain-containing protein, partial [Rubrivirga litoralis]